MRVLLTRPRDDSEALALLLRAQGHQVVVSPVLEIQFCDGPDLSLDGVRAILATSANGIRALARRTARRDVPVFAVGPQTAVAAQQVRFTQVKSADGDAVALANAVQSWAAPEAGALLYAAGQDRRSDLARILLDRGYTVDVAVVYQAIEQPAPNLVAVAALAANEIDAVMLFSPRSAAGFVRQVQSRGLGQDCAGMIALCISADVANALAPLTFRELRIAALPNQEGMLALLG
jgi:uroporphyrinogen-III synthase